MTRTTTKTTVDAMDGEVRVTQVRDGHTHTVCLPLHEIDAVVAWIRSARAAQERRHVVRDVRRLIREVRRQAFVSP
ncbi:MAG TPA: hypothetical protein VHZ49_02695 [Methylomirabilota bacterium]|nr:hypothetical protein [Methylomirabilota bacterium]